MQADLGAPTCNTENPGLLVKWKEITHALIACGHAAELYQELNNRTGREDAAGGHTSRSTYQCHEELCHESATPDVSQLITNSAETNRSICKFDSGDEDTMASSLDESDMEDDIYNDMIVPSYLIDGNQIALERNSKNKRFRWIERTLSAPFSIFETIPSIDHGCQPS
jgi:hypothetical protein